MDLSSKKIVTRYILRFEALEKYMNLDGSTTFFPRIQRKFQVKIW